MKNELEYLDYLVSQGGPSPEQYEKTDNVFRILMKNVREGTIDERELNDIRSNMGEACTSATMLGFVYRKPHGYTGDFEVIDRMYTGYKGPKHLEKWNNHSFHQPALKAVRNRKEYFIDLLSRLVSSNNLEKRVLNVGSGPARDLKDFFDTAQMNTSLKILIECVDNDPNAIKFAQKLTKNYSDKIQFYQKNILRFKPKTKYDLIWSAGLFDYFNDRTFKHCLKLLMNTLNDDGELVIGNFSPNNPSRDYMEFFDWHLTYRSIDNLAVLAQDCGVETSKISVHAENEGVNLFLHIRK